VLLIHSDTTTDTIQGVREFAIRLNGTDSVHHVSGDWEEEVVDLLSATQDTVAIVLAHGEPNAMQLQTTCAGFPVDIVHIALSTKDPSLAVAEKYEQRVASFCWPIRSGAELGAMGAKLRSVLAGSSTEISRALLVAVREYFQTAFVREELLAAYLIRLLYEEDVAFRNRIRELGLDARYGGMSKTQLGDELRRDSGDLAA
jgi:hypothetical protein